MKSDAKLSKLKEFLTRSAAIPCISGERVLAGVVPFTLVFWAIRGMRMGRTFIADRDGREEVVALLSRLIERVVPTGMFKEPAEL